MAEQTHRKSAAAALIRSTVSRWRLPGLDFVNHHQAGQEWAPHWHDEWSVGVITKGSCYCQVGGYSWVLPEGTVLRIAPGTVHTGALLPKADSEAVAVMMWYLPTDWMGKNQIHWPMVNQYFVSDSLAQLVKQVSTELMLVSWLERLNEGFQASEIYPQQVISENAKVTLSKIQNIVLSGHCTVSEAALLCGISREMLHRHLRKWTGMPPEQYFRTIRLNRARHLLLQGQTISFTAEECGFSDQAHFTRWFKRCFGYSPGDLLKTNAPL